MGAQISDPSTTAQCPKCAGNSHAHQEKLTVAQLERLSASVRGTPAAHFDTAYVCRLCDMIYSFQFGTSFVLVEDLPRPHSLRQTWKLLREHMLLSVSRRRSVNQRLRAGSLRTHTLATANFVMDDPEDEILTPVSRPQRKVSVREHAAWNHDEWHVMANWKL